MWSQRFVKNFELCNLPQLDLAYISECSWSKDFFCQKSLKIDKVTRLPFGLFWNSFLEIEGFGHLAFSWPFFNLEENSIFLGLFWQNFNKTYKILWYFKKILIYFRKFSYKIWPFFIFWDLATMESHASVSWKTK